jgi:asparagine synthase (glutamine-hydrolysing)
MRHHALPMCGIAAIHSLDGSPALRGALDRLMPCLAHRGPDGRGLDVDGPTALGHWRLSILDPTDVGAQPMERDGIRLIHNGEVYNYLELRDELAAAGLTFTTETDTEMIIAAYRCWGLDAFSRFNGMWAMILWDPERRRLVASRDRLGVKPLYFRRTPRAILFASEVQALARTASVHDGDTWRPGPDVRAVRDFLERGLSDHSAATFVAGVESLPAGHHLVVEDGAARTVRYWSPPALSEDARPTSAATRDGDARLVEEFRATFDDAVRLRLRSDVPLGSCLSGGLDSSAIVRTTAMLRDAGSGAHEQVAQYAFHARFPGDAIDESRYAELVATQSGVDLVYATAPTDLWARLEDVMSAQGEPFASTSVLAQHTVMEAAHASGLKVMLDGQGADETLGGYEPYLGVRLAGLAGRGHVGGAWRDLVRQARHLRLDRLAARTIRGIGGPGLRSVLRAAMPGRWGIALGPALRDVDTLARWHDLPGTPLARQLWQDTVSESLPALLRYEDRNSMAFAIEARVPFLDYRLVELANRLPDRLRISGTTRKRILRRAMDGRLPAEVVHRRDKMGFFVPQSRWLSQIEPQAAAYLRGGRLTELGWVDAAEIERLLAEPARRNVELWRALNVERWVRRLEDA